LLLRPVPAERGKCGADGQQGHPDDGQDRAVSCARPSQAIRGLTDQLIAEAGRSKLCGAELQCIGRHQPHHESADQQGGTGKDQQ